MKLRRSVLPVFMMLLLLQSCVYDNEKELFPRIVIPDSAFKGQLAEWRYDAQPVVAPHDKVLNPANKDFDDAIKAIQVTTGTERDDAIRKAEKIMMDEAILAPLYYYTYVQIIDESVVEGVARSTMGHWNFKNVKMVG